MPTFKQSHDQIVKQGFGVVVVSLSACLGWVMLLLVLLARPGHAQNGAVEQEQTGNAPGVIDACVGEQGLVITPTEIILSQDADGSYTDQEYRIHLCKRPVEAGVSVNVTSSAVALYIPSGLLFFQRGDWQTPQSVTIGVKPNATPGPSGFYLVENILNSSNGSPIASEMVTVTIQEAARTPTRTPASTQTATAIPTATPTLVSKTATPTSTYTREATKTPVNPTTPAPLYLPIAARQPTSTATATPTATPLPQWIPIGGSGSVVDVVASYADGQTNHLLAGYRKVNETGGGVHRLASCEPNSTLTPLLPNLYILDLSLQGRRGLVGSFGDKVYYTEDVTQANSWHGANGIDNPFMLAVVWTTLKIGLVERSYAGGDDGLYRSEDGGSNWAKVAPAELTTVRTLKLEKKGGDPAQDMLWIGTLAGLWRMAVGDAQPIKESDTGLSGDALKIRDIQVVSSGSASTLYVATDSGVFKRSGTDNWLAVGNALQGKQVLSLEYHKDALYVGIEETPSVYRLEQNEWVSVGLTSGSVRDLHTDSLFCKGLIAATSNGIWVLR